MLYYPLNGKKVVTVALIPSLTQRILRCGRAKTIPLRQRLRVQLRVSDSQLDVTPVLSYRSKGVFFFSCSCSCSCSSLENCTFFRKKYHSYSMNTRTCICVLFPSFFVFMFVFKYGPRGLCAVHFEQFKLCSGERTNTSGGVLPSCSFSSFTLEEESDVGSVVSHVRKDRTQT